MAGELEMVFGSYAFAGSFIATCSYNCSLDATWHIAKEIGQKTLLYTVISVSSITLSNNLALYIKGRVKLINTHEAAARICGFFLAASIVPIYFTANAFPRTFGTPPQALLSFTTSIVCGVLGSMLLPKRA